MIRIKKKKNIYRRAKKKVKRFLYNKRFNINLALACLLILAAIIFVLKWLN